MAINIAPKSLDKGSEQTVNIYGVSLEEQQKVSNLLLISTNKYILDSGFDILTCPIWLKK